jgi:mRNA interferase YafQ
MRHIDTSGSFRKQYKLMLKRGKQENSIRDVITNLANDVPLPPANRDHPLSGNYSGYRDCHIEPDWLLIYKKSKSDDGNGILFLEATGTHADLF